MPEVDRVRCTGAPERRSLRILWVVSKLELEGAITAAAAGAATALAARGHEAHLAGPADTEPMAPPGVTLHRWPRCGKLGRLRRLVQLQRRLRADVIHFHSALPHGEVILGVRALGGWLGRPRLFVTAHSSRPFPKRRARLGLRVADVVVPPSRWSARAA